MSMNSMSQINQKQTLGAICWQSIFGHERTANRISRIVTINTKRTSMKNAWPNKTANGGHTRLVK